MRPASARPAFHGLAAYFRLVVQAMTRLATHPEARARLAVTADALRRDRAGERTGFPRARL